jgi:hypothetical protein
MIDKHKLAIMGKKEKVGKVQNQTKSDKSQRSKESALPILATIPNFCEAAKIIGCSTEQIYTWLKEDSEFKTKLDAMRAEVVNKSVEAAIAKLKNSMTKAVDTLISLLDRQDYPAVQRAASNDLLNHFQKFKELAELEERISKLEQNVT